jgi:hypothetical protein
MAIHQDIQERAREEVISIFGDEPQDIFPALADLKKLDYINMIIKEVHAMTFIYSYFDLIIL